MVQVFTQTIGNYDGRILNNCTASGGLFQREIQMQWC